MIEMQTTEGKKMSETVSLQIVIQCNDTHTPMQVVF